MQSSRAVLFLLFFDMATLAIIILQLGYVRVTVRDYFLDVGRCHWCFFWPSGIPKHLKFIRQPSWTKSVLDGQVHLCLWMSMTYPICYTYSPHSNGRFVVFLVSPCHHTPPNKKRHSSATVMITSQVMTRFNSTRFEFIFTSLVPRFCSKWRFWGRPFGKTCQEGSLKLKLMVTFCWAQVRKLWCKLCRVFWLTCSLYVIFFWFELNKLVDVVSIPTGEVKHSPRLFTTVQAETGGGLKHFSKILEYDAVVMRENLWEGLESMFLFGRMVLEWVPFGGLTFWRAEGNPGNLMEFKWQREWETSCH